MPSQWSSVTPLFLVATASGLGEGWLPAALGLASERLHRAGATVESWHLHRGGTAKASGAGRRPRAGRDGTWSKQHKLGDILVIEVPNYDTWYIMIYSDNVLIYQYMIMLLWFNQPTIIGYIGDITNKLW